jgi:DNA repair protein SbcD/Mre11
LVSVFRILHSADWHLGKTLRGWSRQEELERALEQLVATVEARQPDALVVAGDVFDSPNPGPEAQGLYYRTLVRLHEVAPGMRTVITAGNHDAATRLEAPREVLRGIGVDVVGNVRREELGRHLVRVGDKGHVLAVSYPTPACLGSTRDGVVTATRRLYEEIAGATRAQWEGGPLVVMGHLHVSGAEETQASERRILVGGENAVPVSVFPEGASYVALGHLHKPQAVGGEQVRYSGSLVPLSAAEMDYRHQLVMVEMDGKAVRTEAIVLERHVEFLRVPAKGYAKWNDVRDELKRCGGNEAFVQVKLKREGLPATFREELDGWAQEARVRIVDVQLEEVEKKAVAGAPQVKVKDRDPEEFFVEAFESVMGKAPELVHREIFAIAREKAEQA